MTRAFYARHSEEPGRSRREDPPRPPAIRSRHDALPFPSSPTRQELEAQTRAVADFVLDHVGSLAEQPSFDLDGVEALRASFREPVPEAGRPLAGLLERLEPAIAKSYNTAGPGYLAYIPGGGVYASALADFIATATNRYVGVTAAAPALAQIEETAVGWLCTLMGLPAGARGILTSGGLALELQRAS